MTPTATAYLVAAIVLGSFALLWLILARFDRSAHKFVLYTLVISAVTIGAANHAVNSIELYRFLRASDGHVIYPAQYVFEAVAVAGITVAMMLPLGYGLVDMAIVGALSMMWGAFHLAAAVSPDIQASVILFLFGAAIYAFVLYLLVIRLCAKRDGCNSWYPTMLLWVYFLFTMTLHVSFGLGQNGYGVIDEFWTAIAYAVSDFLVYAILGWMIWCSPDYGCHFGNACAPPPCAPVSHCKSPSCERGPLRAGVWGLASHLIPGHLDATAQASSLAYEPTGSGYGHYRDD